MTRCRLTTILLMLAASLCLTLLTPGCGPQQAYPGPTLPRYKVATLYINPPQSDVGFQLVAINGRPFSADVAVSILPVATKLTVKVWPTSSTTFQMSDPAFAEHYQQIDNKYGRLMQISFEPKAGVEYGLQGNFNQGASVAESNYAVSIFETNSKTIVARASSEDTAAQASEIVERAKERDREQWSVEAGPGS